MDEWRGARAVVKRAVRLSSEQDGVLREAVHLASPPTAGKCGVFRQRTGSFAAFPSRHDPSYSAAHDPVFRASPAFTRPRE